MRHNKAGRKFGRNATHRRAMFRNMVTSLLEHGRITTTVPKAKELRSYVEKTITRSLSVADLVAKAEGERSPADKAKILHAIRMAGRLVRTRHILLKLFREIAPKFNGRPGGYTRIIKMGPRQGDGAPMAIIELV